MATKNEKIATTLIGGTIGLILGNNYAKEHNLTGMDRMKSLLMGASGGSVSGYALSLIFGSPNNTVNYALLNERRKKSNQLVYHGITDENRKIERPKEHIRDGKKFTKVIYDVPKPRKEALKLEKVLIIKDRPLYNIQHNKN